MAFFSIIVPIYKVEEYIEECIESILSQEEDLELILVNDGSPDGSSQICEKYNKSDIRVKLINKENGGLSSARNEGIRASTGEYLVYIDSDDYLGSITFLTELKKAIKEYSPDVICYGWTRFNHSTKKTIDVRCNGTSIINEIDSEKRLEKLMELDLFSISAWTHAIKREFVMCNNLFFDERYRTGEDIEWIFHTLSCVPIIVGIDNTSYMYRLRPDSITTAKRKSGFWQYRYMGIREGLNMIEHCDCSARYKKALYGCVFYMYYILLGEISHEPNRKYRSKMLQLLESYKWLSKYSYGKKGNICKILISIFGVKISSRILGARV